MRLKLEPLRSVCLEIIKLTTRYDIILKAALYNLMNRYLEAKILDRTYGNRAVDKSQVIDNTELPSTAATFPSVYRHHRNIDFIGLISAS